MSNHDIPSPEVSEAAPQGRRRSFPVVGIGASAGGLEAITRLLKMLPPEPGMAFLIVQHLDPHRGSMLAEILSRATVMPVVEAAEGMVVGPDHVYVLPPAADMALDRGALTLRPRAETGGVPMPIDYLFRSLAQDQGSQSIGIVLSGGGSDGSLGLEAIKGEGGITFAQDEQSAQHDSMPRSAVAIGCVDYVLDPEGIARELTRIGGHDYLNGDEDTRVDEIRLESDHLEGIFGLLRTSRGVDFTHYKRNTLLRRLERRMAVRRMEDLAGYHRLLQDDPAEVEALFQDMLIRVTSFFRDPAAFEFLQQKILPDLMQDRPDDLPVRLWVAGCSTGEEVYSLAIALIESLGEKAGTTPIKILASDIDESALERARAGLYIENIAMDVSPERLRRFFTRVNNHYQVAKSIRDLCVFSRHNLTRDPPFAGLDLVCCRNVLIYFDAALQRHVVPLFHYALKPGGHLMLGASETIGVFGELFTLVGRDSKVYQKKESSPRLSFDIDVARGVVGYRPKASAHIADNRGLLELQHEADRLLLSKFAPPGVLVDEEMTILQFRGQTGRFLEPAPGTASLDLLKMVRGGLLADLRAAIAEAKISQAAVRKEGLHIQEGDGFRRVALEVIPLRDGVAGPRHFLVLFEEVDRAPAPTAERPVESDLAPAPPGPESADVRIHQLSQDLEAARHYIQALMGAHEATREELISANEEVLASNEELLSVNEELQSTNEELQTAKEEMHSTNEELATVNDELQHRNLELGRLNDDLSNFIQGVSLAIIMVNRELRIRRFTPPAEQILNLIDSDIGRPLGDIRPNLDVADLSSLVAEVIDTLTPREYEIQDRDGRWYSLRIRPYITSENRIEGAALALLDIDDLKRGNVQLKEARDYADAIVETVWEPLVVLDSDLRICRANQAFYSTFGLSPAEAEGQPMVQVVDDRWVQPELKARLVEILSRNSRLDNFSIEADVPGAGPRRFLLNAHRIFWEGRRTQRILLALEDVTERERKSEQARLLAVEQAARAEAEQANRSKDEFLAMLAHELRNPLAPILSSLLYLRAPGVDAADRGWAIAIMDRQVRHMTRLIDDLLDVSRITRGKIDLRKERVELASIVAHAVEIASPLIDAHRHQLTVALPPEPVELDADPARLEQVVANLLNNAAKYTDEGGQITLTATALDDQLELRVRDSGTGIAPENLPNVFNLFMQADRSLDRAQGGLGIGLTLVRTLVERHGGTVEVQSEGIGRGSEFIVRLPRPARAVGAGSLAGPTSPPDHTPRRVLVVDDNGDAASMLARLLGRWGYIVEVAHDGPAALTLARESSPDIVLLDIGLPGMDGYEVARQLRKETTPPRPMIVALTGYGQEADRRKAREAGFDRHLVKPVDVSALQSVLSAR